MSWGISPNATEKEKIFADFADFLNGLNSAGGLSYHHYSQIFDIGRKLADEEYEQGRADERERIINELEEVKATAIDLVKLPNFIKKDLKELTDMCFDEAIEIVKGGQNE